jgi:NAD(P)-dependent dehydrogenase (short-subunit alcohol dehydrogenase family)
MRDHDGLGAGRTAVVTGAASGIGAATVTVLQAEGWRVVGWDLQAGSNPDVEWVEVDVGDYASVAAAAERLEVVGLLVNSAGNADRAPAAQMTAEQWDRVIRVDLTGTFYCCRALHAALAHSGGVVVNLASIAGHRAFAGRANYCSAKAGITMLTQVLGLEWAADGIRVVAVSPGFVMTPMMRQSVAGGHLDMDALTSRTPQARFADDVELARSIVALARDDFSFMTGSTVLIDGGWCANGGS